MNLLQFKNRFKQSSLLPVDASKVTGYMNCLEDVLAYLQNKTEFNPAKRMIDSVELLDSITDTNAELIKLHEKYKIELTETLGEMSKAVLSGDKVEDFLNGSNDLPDHLFTQSILKEIKK